MPGNKTLKDHEILVSRMAGTLGVDLDEAELRGQIAPEFRDEMVLACTGCADAGACDRWLGENAKADATPAFCRNVGVFDVLRRET